MPLTHAFAYLDDIIVHAKDVSSHLRHLDEVLVTHLRAGLKLQPHKTALLRSEAAYLGHIINAEGIKPDPSKIAVVKNWPECTNITDLQAFLGKCTLT